MTITPPQPEPSAPECSPRISVLQEPDRTVITLQSARWPLSMRIGPVAFFTSWFILNGIIAALFIWSFVRGDPNASWRDLLILAPVWIFGLFLLRIYLLDTGRAMVLIVGRHLFTVARTGFFGRRERHWARSDIIDIRFESASVPLIRLVLRSQTPVVIVRDVYEWDSRWLARTLQNLLGLAATRP